MIRNKNIIRNFIIHRKKGMPIVRFGFKTLHYAKLGNNVRFDGFSKFIGAWNIYIGNDVFFGNDCYFSAPVEIHIGSGCMFGPKVFCISGSHNYDSIDLRAVPYDNKLINLPVIIEENVWIAGNVSIAPGTQIGKGSVVGMGCVVSGKIPPYSVLIGTKAKIIKQRNIENYEKLVSEEKIYNRVYCGMNFEIIKKDDIVRDE